MKRRIVSSANYPERRDRMMKIITNTASTLTKEEGLKSGIMIIPVSVSLGGKSLRDYIDISPDEYVELLKGDEMPVSSQPAIGDMLEELENADGGAIMLTVADGLSGEYSTAMGVRNSLPDRDNIYVINSRSLAGPLRYMALKAAKMRDQGASIQEIVSQSDDFRAQSSFEPPQKSVSKLPGRRLQGETLRLRIGGHVVALAEQGHAQIEAQLPAEIQIRPGLLAPDAVLEVSRVQGADAALLPKPLQLQQQGRGIGAAGESAHHSLPPVQAAGPQRSFTQEQHGYQTPIIDIYIIPFAPLFDKSFLKERKKLAPFLVRKGAGPKNF